MSTNPTDDTVSLLVEALRQNGWDDAVPDMLAAIIQDATTETAHCADCGGPIEHVADRHPYWRHTDMADLARAHAARPQH